MVYLLYMRDGSSPLHGGCMTNVEDVYTHHAVVPDSDRGKCIARIGGTCMKFYSYALLHTYLFDAGGAPVKINCPKNGTKSTVSHSINGAGLYELYGRTKKQEIPKTSCFLLPISVLLLFLSCESNACLLLETQTQARGHA